MRGMGVRSSWQSSLSTQSGDSLRPQEMCGLLTRSGACVPGLLADELHGRRRVTEQRQNAAQRQDGVADGNIAAFGGSIASLGDLHYLGRDGFRQAPLGLSYSGSALDEVRGGDHHGSGDRGKVLIEDGSELVAVVSARQLGQHKGGVPLKDLVLVVQQADEEIEMRVEQVRALFADDAKGFSTAVLDGGLVCYQPLDDCGEQARILEGFANELRRIQCRLTDLGKRSGHRARLCPAIRLVNHSGEVERRHKPGARMLRGPQLGSVYDRGFLERLHCHDDFKALLSEGVRRAQRRIDNNMKTLTSLSKSGPAAAVLLAGVLVLATGCVGDRVTYVQRAYPVAVPAPVPPPPPLAVMPPPPAEEWPPAPPPAPVVLMRSAAELDRMLAPIALYPDPLLAELLPAATLPAEVVLADRYLREGGDLNQVDFQPWDNSLKALARYPATLRMLDENLAWTTDLGQAFLNQPADVMDSVQRLRAQAQAMGNLFSTPQQTVVVDGGIIEIVPAAPQVIYVPVYQPEVVYVQRPPAPGRFFVSFGAGLVVGAWLNQDCDWHAHEVIVWHPDHPRPADWWYHPANHRVAPRAVNNVTVVNNTTIVKHNFTVWRPRLTGAVAADRGDRGWGRQGVRAPASPRNEGARPVREDVRQTSVVAAPPKPVPAREVRPTPPVREGGPGQPEAQRPPARAPETLPNAPHEAVKPTPVIIPREANVVPPARVVPREVSSTKPPVAKAPAPEIARPANGQQASARPAAPAPPPNQPILVPKDTRPVPAPVVLKQPSAAPSAPRHAAPPETQRPAVTAPVRQGAGALAGIESPRVTREASARGQQSMEAIAKPAAAHRPAPAPVPSPKANAAGSKSPQKAR